MAHTSFPALVGRGREANVICSLCGHVGNVIYPSVQLGIVSGWGDYETTGGRVGAARGEIIIECDNKKKRGYYD